MSLIVKQLTNSANISLHVGDHTSIRQRGTNNKQN